MTLRTVVLCGLQSDRIDKTFTYPSICSDVYLKVNVYISFVHISAVST
jgi:hypothetical protein